MKQFLLYCLAVLAAVSLAGCYRDVVSPGADPNGPPQDVSFSGDLVPMLEKNCATSGCHDAIPTKKPSLTSDKAYMSLMNGGYVNVLAPHQSGIYTVVKGGSMPPSGPLKSSDIQKILDWIRNGAPNN